MDRALSYRRTLRSTCFRNAKDIIEVGLEYKSWWPCITWWSINVGVDSMLFRGHMLSWSFVFVAYDDCFEPKYAWIPGLFVRFLGVI